MARYFMAHSSKDKDFARRLAEALGNAWVDFFEIEVGDIILEEIAQGIEDASDFLLLWSRNSADSQWVHFEFHMAFSKWLEDRAIAIRVICLDDTSVPLYLRPFRQARSGTDVEGAVEALRGPPPRLPALRPFVNRSVESERVETILRIEGQGVIWIWGVPGIGKTALVVNTLGRLLTSAVSKHTIEVRAGTGETELYLQLLSALGLDESPTVDPLAESVALAREYAASGGVLIFENAQHWLEDDARPTPILSRVLGELGDACRTAGHVAV